MVDKKKLFIQFEYNAKKAIEKSYKNENGSLEKIEKSIIKIFSELTKKNYNVNTFKKEILKKKIPSTSRSKKILKLMYKLIFLPESDIEKANKNYNLLIKIITKLNEKSCLYEFKADLKKVSKTLFTYKKSKISKLSNKNPDLENKEKTQKTNYKEEEKLDPLENKEKIKKRKRSNALENEEFESSKEKIVNILKSRNVSRDLTYKNCQIKALNYDSNSWKKIEKSIKIKGKNGQNINATISSTPASELGIYTNLKKGQGISSNNRNTDHAMNLWKTEVKTDNGETLFKGLRHGNTRGKESATKEIILAAALDQYGLEKLQNSSEKDVFEVKMGNVQLITDSIIGDGNLGELQKDSFNNLAGKIFEIEIKDKDNSHKKIRLKLKQPILVNFGMNAQYYALDGSLTRSSKGMNSEAFNKLFGENIMKKLKEKFSKKK